MAEGSFMETLIAVGAVTVVLTAVGSILYRITMGDGQAKRLERLKDDLLKKGPPHAGAADRDFSKKKTDG